MWADRVLRAELEGWNAGVRLARQSYERTPIVTHQNTNDQGPGPTVSRARYTDMVRANAQLARELRKARKEIEAAKKTIALAKMRGKPPR